MNTDNHFDLRAILDALANANQVLPRAALQQAVEHWPDVGPALLEMLRAEADGTEPSERRDSILFFGIYLMAQMRETAAYQPLCAIAANDDRIFDLIEDGVTEDLPCILARLFNGDLGPLRMLMEASDANDFARDAGFDALAWLTAAGRVDRDETEAYLRELFSSLLPREESMAWVGWQQAIAFAGLDALAPLVEEIFDRGWSDLSVMSLCHFQEDLAAAKQAAKLTDTFRWNEARLDDAAAHLGSWYSFRPKDEPKHTTAPLGLTAADGVYHNPYRGIGRNDPCPCGSGKKFKKCCLDKVS